MIALILLKNIVRDAIGMNNHMGSAATADPQLMTYLMTALQEKHLFFLDSRTIGKSVAGKNSKRTRRAFIRSPYIFR